MQPSDKASRRSKEDSAGNPAAKGSQGERAGLLTQLSSKPKADELTVMQVVSIDGPAPGEQGVSERVGASSTSKRGLKSLEALGGKKDEVKPREASRKSKESATEVEPSKRLHGRPSKDAAIKKLTENLEAPSQKDLKTKDKPELKGSKAADPVSIIETEIVSEDKSQRASKANSKREASVKQGNSRKRKEGQPSTLNAHLQDQKPANLPQNGSKRGKSQPTDQNAGANTRQAPQKSMESLKDKKSKDKPNPRSEKPSTKSTVVPGKQEQASKKHRATKEKASSKPDEPKLHSTKRNESPRRKDQNYGAKLPDASQTGANTRSKGLLAGKQAEPSQKSVIVSEKPSRSQPRKA